MIDMSSIDAAGEAFASTLRQTIVLAGATATGKSELALALAERIQGEIVTIDSMQVYQGMNIGTAKPTLEDQARVPHHLLDMVPITQAFDVAQFLQHAQHIIPDILGRGRTPILCGGTGLYYRALSDGIGHGPPPDPELRCELEATPITELLEKLQQADPVAWGQIDRTNKRRVVRALEVILISGQPLNASRPLWSAPQTPVFGKVWILDRPPETLRTRIHGRIELMIQNGWIDEVQSLVTAGLESNPTARQAIGYRQWIEYFRGLRAHDETVVLIKNKTWQFAKRQRTWFRHQLQGETLTMPEPHEICPLIDTLERHLTEGFQKHRSN